MSHLMCGCKADRDTHTHTPLHHFNVEAEALVNGIGFPSNAGLELEHLWLV